ncbi:MAG TPA: hypothetical protein VHQ24_08105, partial [Lachnospiraceae bacterium]|nr:hypothetical protein [Lachnospiraceae bacterium]
KEVIKQRDSESLSNEVLELPRTLDGKEISYKENKEATSEMIFFLGIISAILIVFLSFTQLDRKRKDREMELMMSYPDMINKVILLLGAGMTIRNVWGKISGEYKEKLERRKEGERYVYEEMLVTWNEMCNGRSELDAYDAFGKRVKLKPYLKFSSLLVQNAKKGTTDLLHSLEYEAIEAFEVRKETAKRLGEEAGTKLLAPMMLMLFIVLMIIIVPAFLSM